MFVTWVASVQVGGDDPHVRDTDHVGLLWRRAAQGPNELHLSQHIHAGRGLHVGLRDFDV